jgi:hypothetical protein
LRANFGTAAAERRGLPGQVLFSNTEQLARSVDDARAAGDRRRGIDLELERVGMENPAPSG